MESSSEKSTVLSTAEDSLIYIDKTPYTNVTEGKATVLFPSTHDVFYNPVQEFNRDISIAVLKHFASNPPPRKKDKRQMEGEISTTTRKIRVLEALSASGLRSIRFAKEVPNIEKIIANDRDSQAFASIQRNIDYNDVGNIVEAVNEDASLLMYMNRQYKDKFDVVDLDPYGTAAPFLDAAVQCVVDGGLLMVTCTDMGILCGNGIEACHAKYGATSMKIGSCHEMALRIVLQSIESHANRYGRYIEPLLCISVDFYIRLFVRIYTSPLAVKQSLCKLSMVYMCSGCSSFHLQPIGNRTKTEKGEKFTPGIGPPVNRKCDICGHSFKIGGPIWSSKLHNREFVQKTIDLVQEENNNYGTSKRILGLLNVILEELEDCPLFYRTERLTSVLHCQSPTNVQIRSAFLNAGYKVSMSHALPTSIKTNAPLDVVWDIMRTWAKLNPGKKTFEEELSKTIMAKEPCIEVSFASHPDAIPHSYANNLLRFQINPKPNWGPKCRATTSLLRDVQEERRIKNQNKRSNKTDIENGNKKFKPENVAPTSS